MKLHRNGKTLFMGLSLAAMVAAGSAYAQADRPAPGGDKDGNGVITRAEAQTRATTMFARMDTNKDGQLDKADRELKMQERKTRMFDMMDTDKNGAISRTEFMAAHPAGDKRGPGMAGKDGKRGGDRMAMADNGHEGGHKGGHEGRMGRHRGMDHGMHGAMGARMGKMADADSNGSISQAEFTAAAMTRFDAMDADKDGTVTQAERQKAREDMRAKWQERREARDADAKAS